MTQLVYKNCSFLVHSFNEHYLSIFEYTGSWVPREPFLWNPNYINNVLFVCWFGLKFICCRQRLLVDGFILNSLSSEINNTVFFIRSLVNLTDNFFLKMRLWFLFVFSEFCCLFYNSFISIVEELNISAIYKSIILFFSVNLPLVFIYKFCQK